MIGFLRFLMVTFLLVVALGAGGLYAAYGQIEPCRVLAAERARRDGNGGPWGPAMLEGYERIQTSQMSSSACARDLLDSWGERLKAAWK